MKEAYTFTKDYDPYGSENNAIGRLYENLNGSKIISNIKGKKSFSEIRESYWKFFEKNKKFLRRLDKAIVFLKKKEKYNGFYSIINVDDYKYRKNQDVELSIEIIKFSLKVYELPENKFGKFIGDFMINCFVFMSR